MHGNSQQTCRRHQQEYSVSNLPIRRATIYIITQGVWFGLVWVGLSLAVNGQRGLARVWWSGYKCIYLYIVVHTLLEISSSSYTMIQHTVALICAGVCITSRFMQCSHYTRFARCIKSRTGGYLQTTVIDQRSSPNANNNTNMPTSNAWLL